MANATGMSSAPSIGATPTAFAGMRSGDRALGIAIMSGLPALFWVLVLGLAGPSFGIELRAVVLAEVGIAVAMFLALVVSALPARPWPNTAKTIRA